MAASRSTQKSFGQRGSTAKGISFSALAGIASLAAGILLLPIVLTSVGPAAYGVWLFLLASASFLFFLDFGVGIAIIHFLARSRSGDDSCDPNAIVSTAYAWATTACLLAMALFIWVATSYRDQGLGSVSTEEYPILVGCCVALLATMSLRPMSSVLFGAGFLHVERRNQLIGVALRISGTLGACGFEQGIVGVVVAETAALMTPTLLSAAGVHRMQLVKVRWRSVSKTELVRMLHYSLRSFSVSLVGASILQFGTLAIGILGSSNQVAYFNAAFRVYVSVRQVISWLTEPFRSVLSRLYVRDEGAATKVLYDLLFVSFMTSTLGCGFLFITLPVVLKLWLGDSVPTNDVTTTASVLLAGLVLNALHIPLVPAADAAGSPGAFLPHQVLWLLAYVGLSALFYPVLGITGVALAMTIPLPLLEFVYLLTAKRVLGLDLNRWFRRVIIPTLPVLGLGLSAAGATAIHEGSAFVISAAFAFLISAVGTLYLTRSNWLYRSVMDSLRIEA